VLKIERDGSSRVRLVALGYSQESGLIFIDNYSLVVNDVSFREILILIQAYKSKPILLSAETSFLNGISTNGLNNEKGKDAKESTCLKLHKQCTDWSKQPDNCIECLKMQFWS
jgi:hypothetical protein